MPLTEAQKRRRAQKRKEAKLRAQQIGQQVVPKGTFSKGGSSLGALAGGMLGGAPGRQVGSTLGKALGGALSRLVGFGDYRVEENSIVTKGGVVPHGEEIPKFGFHGEATRITHREYVMDLVVPDPAADFDLESFAINAGNRKLFPWLATIAGGYQQYRIRGMVIEFRSLSSDISTGGPLGAVIMATNYNANAVEFTTKIDMENSEYACSTKPSNSMVHTIECAKHDGGDDFLYIRQENRPDQLADSRLYDLGTFQLATKGLPGTAGDVLGELWVSYEVDLYKPILNPLTDYYFMINTTTDDPSMTGATPFGTPFAGPYGSGRQYRGSAAYVVDGDKLVFPYAGQYYVSITVSGTSLGGFSNTLQLEKSLASAWLQQGSVSGQVYEIGIQCVTVPGDYISFDIASGTYLSMGVFVAQLPWVAQTTPGGP